MAMVSAVRKTSMVFAVMFGVVFLRERFDVVRLVSISITLIGTALLRVSR